MASSKANQKKTKKACNALKHLGISAKAVRLALKRLLKAYENNWTYIEEENYRVLIDAIFEPGEPMVLDKPILRFDNEEPDFNFCEEPDEEEIEPLRKKPRTQNRPSPPAGSSVPRASELQQMVEHDFRAMDILERDMPNLVHFYRRKDSNGIEKVQHDFNLFGDSDEEEIETRSQDRPSSPAGRSVPCSSNYESAMHKNMDDKGNENEDEDKIATPCLSQIDIVSSSNGEVKLGLYICKPSLGFRVPSLDAVMKQVEEKYRENFQGLGVEFTLSELLKEICERFVEQGNVSQSSNQSPVQTFENFMEAEKQCGQLSLSTTPSDHTDAPVPIPRYVVSSPLTNVHVVNGNNQSLVQTFENLMETEKQCDQLSLSNAPFDHTDAPVTIPRYVVSSPFTNVHVVNGNNQSLVQTFENLTEAEKQCDQLSLSNAPFDHTDAPVPIPRYVVSSPFTNVHVVNGVYSDVFNRTFRKQNTPVVDNLSDSTSLTLCLKDDSLQRGIQANLQVFMTAEGKGWGLRTLEDLPKGTFVCEYVGEIVINAELFEQNEQNTDEKHTYPVLLDEGFLKDEEALCLDATSLGNVARFINHRCEDANLVVIPVEHAFVTSRDVKAMEELTWDYGIDFDDDSRPVTPFHCKCGSRNCRQTKHQNDANMAYDKQLIVRI